MDFSKYRGRGLDWYLSTPLYAWRILMRRRHAIQQKREQAARRRVIDKYESRVADGPFAGMAYVKEAYYSAYSSKILGCYEAELSEVIEQAIRAGYDHIIDIGAAEGYYAVGLALRVPAARVTAFELDEHAQHLCSELALINGVESRVEVRGACDLNSLQEVLKRADRTLVICDVEGYEIELMDPGNVPALSTCDLIIELHDCFNQAITPTLSERFSTTHDLNLISVEPRDPRQVPACHFLPWYLRKTACSDGRGFWMQWGVFKARQKHNER